MTKILSFLGWGFINLISLTLRTRIVNPLNREKGNLAFAFWHGEQFILNVFHKNKNAVIMSSMSKDGEIQAGILSHFGYKIVRGSSTRRAERALVETIMYVKRGHDAGFAVDGPKGPLKRVKPGIIYVAMKCGVPIVPVSSCSEKKYVLARAWDKYELPRPFTRAVIAYGEPVIALRTDNVEEKALELERSLTALSDFTHGSYWSKDIKEYLSGHPRPKILIVQPSRIGDVVFTLPSVHAIRKKYPKAWIGWLVDERCAQVLEGNNDIDEIIIVDRHKISLRYLLGLTRDLRSRKIDLSIDFHGLFKSAFLVKLAGAKFKLASSSTNGMRELSWLFSKEIKPPKSEIHCVERHFAVASYLDCTEEDKFFKIETSQAVFENLDKIFAEKGIDTAKPFAAIHPGGGWLARRWAAERYSQLIDRVSSELGLQIVLVGGKEGGAGEKGLNEEIISKSEAKIFDFTGLLDLKELAGTLKKCAVFVANEAGPMHIATALNIPAVAIIGPTDPGRTGPYKGNTNIIRHKVSCQPCRNRNCATKECMELVTVDEVFDAVKSKLKSI
jgi:lipopolysaccharide heptosyltransferase II